MFNDSFPRRLVRGARGRQQTRALEAFLDRELRGAGRPTGDGESLADRRGRRRTLAERPRVVGFGTSEWEQHGLWPAFAEVADFTLWQYREPFVAPAATGPEYRRTLAAAFVDHIDSCSRERPVDAVFFYASAEHIDESLIERLAERGVWSWVMGLDDKHQFFELDDARGSQIDLATRCDLYLTTWSLGATIVRRRGGRVWYTGAGANQQFHRSIRVERDLDVVFVGQAYGERRALVRYLRERGIQVAAFGAGWPGGHLTFDEQIAVYSRARVVLGVGGVRQMVGVTTVKGRDFEVPMCGALYLTSYCPDLLDFFRLGEEILCYGSFQDCREQVESVLAEPDEAERIRRAALERSLRDHTWQKRIQDGLELLRTGEPADA